MDPKKFNLTHILVALLAWVVAALVATLAWLVQN